VKKKAAAAVIQVQVLKAAVTLLPAKRKRVKKSRTLQGIVLVEK